MIRRILTLFAAALLAAPAAAQEARGDWQGTLQVTPQQALPLVIHIRDGEDGKLAGTMDSPAQGAFGIPLAEIVATPEKLAFTVPAVTGSYDASWDAASGTWKGTWRQSGLSWPLAFAPTAAAAAAPPPAPPPADWQLPSNADIGAMIEKRLAGRSGGAMVIGVSDGGKQRLANRGLGDAAAPGAIFEIGSMTKVFTALLLADMAQRGEVKLDDPAEKYLPEGATMPMKGRKITLADLAMHRSGLPRLPGNMTFADMSNPYADYDEARLLAFLAQYQLTRAPEEQFEYSNLGTGLLGYLLARVAGQDYATLVRERITGPLGMKDTRIALDAKQKARFVQGHDANMKPVPGWDLDALAGAGALRSTAPDMLRFLEAAMGTRKTALAPAFAAMLAQTGPGPAPRVEMGLGWMVIDGRTGTFAFHDGGTGGFRGTMAFDASKKRAVIVLANAAAEPSTQDLAVHLLTGLPVAETTPAPAAN